MSIPDNTSSIKPETLEKGRDIPDTPLPVIFVVMQTGERANGGVESITQILERVRQIRPIVVTQIETPANRRWSDAGAEVQVWPVPYRIGSSFYQSNIKARVERIQSLLQTNHQMYELVRATGCQVVHCNDPGALWHTALGARIAKAMVVLNIRGLKPAEERYGWKWQFGYCRVSNYQLLLSGEMRDSFASHLSLPLEPRQGRKPRTDYIYSIVDATKMYPVNPVERESIRRCLGIGSDIFAIGYIGSFNRFKAQLNFIEQAGLLFKASLPQAKIYFIGDFEPERNDYARDCLNAVKRLGLEDITALIGYTPNVPDWYRAVDAVIIASPQEGLARAMIEGLACGTPVVSFDVCSAREILEQHHCGLVVPQGDYAALVKQTSYLAEDKPVRLALGENGACLAKKLFDPGYIVQKYEDLYLSLALETQSTYFASRLKT